jgi:hypothetical protein
MCGSFVEAYGQESLAALTEHVLDTLIEKVL